MTKKIVQVNVTGIKHLEKKLGKKIRYSADRDVYFKGVTVYSEEFKRIKIYTDVSTLIELENFVTELNKTDIVLSGKFKEIKIYCDKFDLTTNFIGLSDKEGLYILINL